MKLLYLKVQQGILELHKEQVEVEQVKDGTKDQQTTNTEYSSDDEIIDGHDGVINDQDDESDDQDNESVDQHQELQEPIQTTTVPVSKQRKRKNLTVKGKSKKARIS